MKRTAVIFGILAIFLSSLFLPEGVRGVRRRKKVGDDGRLTKVM